MPGQPMDPNAAEIVVLRGGTPVAIRPIRTDDAPRLQALATRLSAQTVYLRFMTLRRILLDSEARHLTQVDYDRRMALVATSEPQGSDDIIGVARYAVARAQEEAQAEVAIVVEDDYQNQSLGRLLLRQLAAYARAHGIHSFRATISLENDRIFHLIQRTELPTRSRWMGQGQQELSISLLPRQPRGTRLCSQEYGDPC